MQNNLVPFFCTRIHHYSNSCKAIVCWRNPSTYLDSYQTVLAAQLQILQTCELEPFQP